MSVTVAANSEPKIGSWKGGWLLARASWSTLKLDKELVFFPLISGFYTFLWAAFVFLAAGAIYALSGGDFNYFVTATEQPMPDWAFYLMMLPITLGTYVISNYFMAALIASAIHRFKGGDPTYKYGIERARRQKAPLIKFSLLQGTIGWILRLAEEKLPLAGKVTAYIVDLAWHFATLFAVAVIVTDEEETSPTNAIKRSAKTFLKVWDKNFTGGLTLGVIFLPLFLLWALLFGALFFFFVYGNLLFVLWLILAAVTLMTLIAFVSALNGIFNAALYHYATTGSSPVEFDKDLLRAAFKPKKGWFV